MAGISVEKNNKPRVQIAGALIDETKKLSQKWQGKSSKSIAQMLVRAIPGYQLAIENEFILIMNIPGGKKAKMPLESVKNGSAVNIINIIPGRQIHIC